MRGSEKMDISSVVTGRDASKVLELVEATLDAIAQPIGIGVMSNDGYSIALGRDHGLCDQAGHEAARFGCPRLHFAHHKAGGALSTSSGGRCYSPSWQCTSAMPARSRRVVLTLSFVEIDPYRPSPPLFDHLVGTAQRCRREVMLSTLAVIRFMMSSTFTDC
jgi:hypothetical protein